MTSFENRLLKDPALINSENLFNGGFPDQLINLGNLIIICVRKIHL